MKLSIVAFVPMRHSSERVVGKNYRRLGGKPLFHHIVESLLACSHIDQVVIDTDSPLIMEDARAAFPTVRIIERPQHLLGADVPMNQVLLHDICEVAGDLYLQTHSTNPLLSPATITTALETFLSSRGTYD